MLLGILAHYPWAMGVLLGDIHLSELERLNNLAPQQGLNCRPSDLKSKTLRAQPFFINIKDRKGLVVTTPEFIIKNKRWLEHFRQQFKVEQNE